MGGRGEFNFWLLLLLWSGNPMVNIDSPESGFFGLIFWRFWVGDFNGVGVPDSQGSCVRYDRHDTCLTIIKITTLSIVPFTSDNILMNS